MITTRPSVVVANELRDLIPRFLAHRRMELDQLRAALAGADLESARRIGHSLKGVGGGYGFDEITRIGADIERCARDRRTDTLPALAAELGEYLDSVEIRFE
jgi:HPt (histidine-containing phosphotransfer) domain-containing protein